MDKRWEVGVCSVEQFNASVEPASPEGWEADSTKEGLALPLGFRNSNVVWRRLLKRKKEKK